MRGGVDLIEIPLVYFLCERYPNCPDCVWRGRQLPGLWCRANGRTRWEARGVHDRSRGFGRVVMHSVSTVFPESLDHHVQRTSQ
jgi:hypothetical protein